jgi:hypothetical protein
MKLSARLVVTLCAALPAGVGASTDPVVSIKDATATESSGAIEFTVTVAGLLTSDLTVQWLTEDLTATAGTDYDGRGGTVTFPASSATETSTTIRIPLVVDNLPEGNEVFFVRLTDADLATIGVDRAHGVILDTPVRGTVPVCNLVEEDGAPILLRYFVQTGAAGTPDPLKHTPEHVLIDGQGSVTREGAPMEKSDWQIVVIGDFDASGSCDALWVKERHDEENGASGPDFVITAVSTVPERATGIRVLPPLAGWELVGSGDFDGDGGTDVLWWGPATGKLSLWKSGTPPLEGRVPVHGWPWQEPVAPIAVARLSGDGAPNIIWRGDEPIGLWPEDGTPPSRLAYTRLRWSENEGVFANDGGAKLDPAIDRAGSNVVAAADFDLDGYDDLLWQEAATGRIAVTFMRGTALRASTPLSPDRFLYRVSSDRIEPAAVIGPR